MKHRELIIQQICYFEVPGPDVAHHPQYVQMWSMSPVNSDFKTSADIDQYIRNNNNYQDK